MKKIFSQCMLGILLLFVGACTKNFDEINTNPNAPENVSMNLLLTNILHQYALNLNSQAINRGNSLAQYTALFDFNDIEQYEFDANPVYWANLYKLLHDNQTLHDMAVEKNHAGYQAISLVMKALIASQLTDLWGDVPFFEAGMGHTENFTPVYNLQEEIYTAQGGIISSLEKAEELLSGTIASKVDGDIYYNGNYSQWLKFCNSLHLRFLIRISDKIDNASKISAIITTKPLFESNADNAVLHSLSSKPNEYNVSTWRFGDFNLVRMCNFTDSVLKALNDGRIASWFAITENAIAGNTIEYKGMPVGLETGTQSALGLALTSVSRLDSSFHFVSDAWHNVVMNYSEVQFLIAEAIHKGYASGDASVHYSNGIEASFEYHNAYMQVDYLTSAQVALSSDSGVAYEQILTQKWLANFNVGYEGWLDFKRTGYPQLFKLLDNANISGDGDKIPSRYLYPTEEQTLNASNFERASNGNDDINTKIWWEK